MENCGFHGEFRVKIFEFTVVVRGYSQMFQGDLTVISPKFHPDPRCNPMVIPPGSQVFHCDFTGSQTFPIRL